MNKLAISRVRYCVSPKSLSIPKKGDVLAKQDAHEILFHTNGQVFLTIMNNL